MLFEDSLLQGDQRTSQSRNFNNTEHTIFSKHSSTQVKKTNSWVALTLYSENGTAQLPLIGFYFYLNVSSFHEVQAFAS